MTKIIGHRGALGLTFENTLTGIAAAMALPLYAIEIDVRRTKDGQLVLLHDNHTGRVAKRRLRVRDCTLAELQELKLKNGEHIPSLQEVFALVGNKVQLMLDIKDSDVADELLHLLELYPGVQVFCSGRQYDDLKRLHAARPELTFLLQHHHDPIDIIHAAHTLHASGICLNMWLMNPWTYKLAQEHGLQIYVYTVNHRWILNFYRRLYPDTIIISNHPERLIGRPTKRPNATAKDSPSTTPSQ